MIYCIREEPLDELFTTSLHELSLDQIRCISDITTLERLKKECLIFMSIPRPKGTQPPVSEAFVEKLVALFFTYECTVNDPATLKEALIKQVLSIIKMDVPNHEIAVRVATDLHALIDGMENG